MHGTLTKLNVLEVEPEFHINHYILLLIEVAENDGPVMLLLIYSLLIIIVNEQQAYKFVQCSDLAKK